MCGHDKFDQVIDFGMSPLVNSLLDSKDSKEEVYPLEVVRCQKCSLVQTKDPIDTDKVYVNQDYLYYTGDMPQDSQYMKSFDSLVYQLHRYCGPGDLVIEIGSNDGTILKKLAIDPVVVLGVDPAVNVVMRALKNGVPTLSAPFNKKVALDIKKELGFAKVIGGANCLAHIDDLDSVMEGVKELLMDDGVFWVECNYWGGMVEHNHYALIYHDHLSYFTLQNWVDYLPKFGLKVFDAQITEAQGNGLSIRIFASKEEKPTSERMEELLKEEKETGLNNQKACKKFKEGVEEKALKLNKLVSDFKKQGKKIAGYGAAAKGFSILHLAKINEKHIDYFVDDSPAKQGKYCPITHIPVISRKEAEEKLPDYFFITAPNYVQTIMAKEQKFLDNGGKFILEDGEVIG